MMRTFCICLLASLVAASPFDPHLQRYSATSPWFEGWFLRLTDSTTNRSVAFVIGAFQPPNSTTFSQVYAAILLRSDLSTTLLQQAFLPPATFNVTRAGHPIVAQPDPSSAALFEMSAGQPDGPSFELVVRDDVTQLRASIGNLSIHINTTSREPFDKERPDGGSPMGWLERLDPSGVLIPSNYYIHSTGSAGSYDVTDRSAPAASDTAAARLLRGAGRVHQETNWGRAFPDGWLWVQGTRQDGLTLVMTQVSLELGPLQTNGVLVSIRSAAGLSWDLLPIDGCTSQLAVDGCAGTISVNMTCPLVRRTVRLSVGAPEVGFSAPLFFPSEQGFTNNPGCVESYGATAYIQAIEDGQVVLDEVLPFTALEFGGKHRCVHST